MAATSRRSFLTSLPAASTLPAVAFSGADDLKLWYRRPAELWSSALPVGNGRLGAMVFGGVPKERLQLKEDTLWSGHHRDCNNPGARDYLAEVRPPWSSNWTTNINVQMNCWPAET
jgi:alpha-L-fucosidase 2